jgi:excinuclease ABC subunit C
MAKDGARYFGPFTDAGKMRQTQRFIHKYFRIRTCNYNLPDPKNNVKICLEYHIKRCPGPCEDLVSEEEYCKKIDEIVLFLSGRSTELLDRLEARMKSLSENMEFEEAAVVRDQIEAIESVRQRQRVVSDRVIDRDIAAFACSASDAACVVLQIREGVLIGRQHFYLKIHEDTPESEIAETFIKQHYMHSGTIPKEIYISAELNDKDLLESWLSEKREEAVKIFVPQKGEKLKLVEMAANNSRLLLNELLLQKQNYRERIPEAVMRLQSDLRLPKIPATMACFDISNLGESDKVGSLVFFEKGKPKKSLYRHYKIKTVKQQDDYASLREIVYRYFRRLIEEDQEFPDLLVIDGGKGQLSAALDALIAHKIENQQVIGLAKRLEEIFLPGHKDPIMIPRTSPALRLLQRIRNEAHRFAIEFNRKLRGKRTIGTELQKIPGIGPKKAQILLKHFGSVKMIKQLTAEQIAEAPNIGLSDARKICDYFE